MTFCLKVTLWFPYIPSTSDDFNTLKSTVSLPSENITKFFFACFKAQKLLSDIQTKGMPREKLIIRRLI